MLLALSDTANLGRSCAIFNFWLTMKSSTSETASPVCFWSNDWQAGVHLFYVQD